MSFKMNSELPTKPKGVSSAQWELPCTTCGAPWFAHQFNGLDIKACGSFSFQQARCPLLGRTRQSTLRKTIEAICREMKLGELDNPPRRYIKAREDLERAVRR